MDDASGKFALVMLRADQVRVHHKRTKHEYVFRVAGSHLDVGHCILHPNPAALSDPRSCRDEAQLAAEWFVANRVTTTAPVPQRQCQARMGGGVVELVWMALRGQPMPPSSTGSLSLRERLNPVVRSRSGMPYVALGELAWLAVTLTAPSIVVVGYPAFGIAW